MTHLNMDALSSFTFLADNIPSWIKDLEDLNKYTTQKHEEFAQEFSKTDKGHSEASENSSIKSLRTNNPHEAHDSNHKATTDASPPQYPPLDLASKSIFAAARRKRKAHTNSARSGASGPQKFRMRHMVVVWYDSVVQQSLEGLVRNIASARNTLRKGKMSAVVKNGFQLPSFSSDTSPMSYKSVRSSALPLNGARAGNMFLEPQKRSMSARSSASPFDTADKELEAAQSLCEVAAHQFLRDGDCQFELQGIRQRLEATLVISKTEREKLKEEKMNEERQEIEDMVKEEKSWASADGTTMATAKTIQPVNVQPGVIEVDDGPDSGSIEFDLSAFRAARLAPRARARVA